MYFFIIALRILAAPLIFIWPLPAIILSVFLDIIDADFAYKVVSKKKYEQIDKNLDFWWFVNIMFYAYSNFPQYKLILFGLFIYRFVGQALFAITDKRIFLMYFPNFFEWIFFLIFFGSNYWPVLINNKIFYALLGLIVVVKIAQEWFLHIADLSLRQIIFKFDRKWQK